MAGEGQKGADLSDRTATIARFAATVAARREAAGLSQGQVSYKSRLDPAEVSRLELGKREPRLWTIVRLARGLGVDPGDLLDDLR